MNWLSKSMYNLKTLFLPCQENDHKIKFLYKNYFALCVIIVICLKLFIIPVFVIFPQNIFFADISKIALINIINQEREKNNLCLLESNSILDKAAEYKARDMLEHNYFEHNSPSGITPWHWFEKVNYNYVFAGENLAIGFLESEEVYSAWMNSPSHKANLMNSDYQELGIAIIDGNFDGNETSIIVQTFGSPQKAIQQQTIPIEQPIEEPITPIAPIAPTEPTEPIAPARSGFSADDAGGPIEPVGPIGSIEPTEPVEPIEPTTPILPTEPIEPVEPITPIEPTELQEPARNASLHSDAGGPIGPAEQKKTPQVQGIQSFAQISSAQDVSKQELKNNIKFSIWKFMTMDYYDLVQKLILYLLLFSSLLVSLLFSFKTSALDKHLISKTILCMLILTVFYLIDKQSILQIIPHELII